MELRMTSVVYKLPGKRFGYTSIQFIIVSLSRIVVYTDYVLALQASKSRINGSPPCARRTDIE